MQTAKKLQQKVTELKAVIQKKDTQIKFKDTQLAKNKAYIENLESALIELKKYRFGSSSEKQKNKDQLPLFNEIELIDDTKKSPKPPRKKKKTGKRGALPDNLERINKEHDLDKDQKKCPHDQSELKHIGQVTTEQLYFKPAVIKVIKHIQYKYACQCCGKYIITAKKPKEIIPKSIATAELLPYITVSKYADSLPLYRLTDMFKRLDVKISRQNMSNWMIKCSIAIQPLVNMIRDELYDQPCIHIDETTLQVLNEPGKKATGKSYMWVQRAKNNIVFDYQDNRSSNVVEKLLSGYDGSIMTDGYKAYDKVATKYKIIHLACWVHARRYFIKVLEHGVNVNASKMVTLIAKLYAIEKRTKDYEIAEIYEYRQLHSKPILKEIKLFIDEVLHSTAPAGAMGKALKYINNQWHKLIRYIDDGNYPIDNNVAENAIRPFVVGRKNWLFSNTQSGAHASANMYSLIETVKAHGLNPQEYLNHVYKEIPLVDSIEGYEKLLPWNFKSDNAS